MIHSFPQKKNSGKKSHNHKVYCFKLDSSPFYWKIFLSCGLLIYDDELKLNTLQYLKNRLYFHDKEN